MVAVRTHYSMAVGNDERFKLNGTDDEERSRMTVRRPEEGRDKEGFKWWR